ncbi:MULTISPECIES: hypothetical protein [unclassified Virgibacillus]|uniref:hypothetical protein n=1 Tax=unclassified Virgibacillus TaxID=2620237 RepID=UPI0024DE6560|nr:hypothetical protein [Virgibacillus sp. LDC-1]
MENQTNQDHKDTSVVEETKASENNTAKDYFQFVKETIQTPDLILSNDYKGYHMFGLINMIVFVALIILSEFIGTMTLYGEFSSYFTSFEDYFDHFSRAISYAIALAALLPVYKWYAEKLGSKLTVNYFMEKLGATFIIPVILLAASIPLEILDIQVHYWLSSLGPSFMYVGVFLISYLYVARNNLKVATVFLFAFYCFYRIILMLI